MSSTPPTRPDRLRYTIDGDGALVVRRKWGAGVVVLDWIRSPPVLSGKHNTASFLSVGYLEVGTRVAQVVTIRFMSVFRGKADAFSCSPR
jgi:hypothetical protein